MIECKQSVGGGCVERKDNYLLQAQQAKQHFLTYNQKLLADKLGAEMDEQFLYVRFLNDSYRIHRQTVDIRRLVQDVWMDANSYEEVMTLLDLVCDSRTDRRLSGRWRSMSDFGLQFHQNLLEEKKDALADRIDRTPEFYKSACMALGGKPVSNCDIGYAFELFDGLEICVQFWHGDEEFYPRIRFLWDENALQYLRYETMYFAVGLLRGRLREYMDAMN